MEIVEFFFGNFWHWLGLVVILAIIFHQPLIGIDNSSKRDNEEEKKDEQE